MSIHEHVEQAASTAPYRVPRRAIALLAPAAWLAARSAAADAPTSSAAAREVAGRLIAPCCWTQTLDVHESPLADQLRAEIGKRLRAGEPAAAIEDDLAARYGEKIRAVPRGEDPRVALPILVGGAMGLAVIGLAWMGAKWLRRTRTETQQSAEASLDTQQYDKQLDKALDKLSDQT